MQVKDAAMSPEHLAYLRSLRRKRRNIAAARVLLLVALLLLWEVGANLGWVNPFITSQPSGIVRTIANLYRDGELFRHIGVTVYETVVGFTLGTLLGTAIAVVLWWWEGLAKVLEPYLVVLNSLPKISLGPIIIVWIGSGSAAIIVMAL
ncbi:MAG TPA: ABC transporter permease, partial [Bacillota bacterium]|nr:ABC transporter permease [Bacillota bacterium]